jgi:hypothetical protein
VSSSQIANIDHGLAQGVLYNTITHADNEKEEEGERISSRIQDCNDDHQDFRTEIGASAIHVIFDSLARSLEGELYAYHKIPTSSASQLSRR